MAGNPNCYRFLKGESIKSRGFSIQTQSLLSGATSCWLLLIAQEARLIHFDRPLVGDGIVAVLQPVLNQVEIVSDTATVKANPVDSFDEQSLKPVSLEGSPAEF